MEGIEHPDHTGASANPLAPWNQPDPEPEECEDCGGPKEATCKTCPTALCDDCDGDRCVPCIRKAQTGPIPPECPACNADLTGEDAMREHDLLPVTYGGQRAPDGEWENDGHGFKWHDQDGTDRELVCTACEHVVVPSDYTRVERQALKELEDIVLVAAELDGAPDAWVAMGAAILLERASADIAAGGAS